MHLVYDARHIAEPFTGLGRYSGELLTSLLAHHDALNLRLTVLLKQDWHDPNNLYERIIDQACSEGRCDVARVPVHPISLKQHVTVGMWLNRCRPDAYFYPHFDAPLFTKVPTTFVVHDLIPLKIDGYIRRFGAIKRQYFKMMILLNLLKQRTCFADSRTTLSDMLQFYPSHLHRKIQACLLGVSPPDLEEPDQSPCVQQPYLLYVGDRRPHKHIRRTIDIFRELTERWDYEGQLVLAGTTVNHDFDVDAYIGSNPRIQVLGNVNDKELNALYRHADALMLLSAYEGFGLPVVEASKWGRKVIVSDGGSLPEIAPSGSCIVPLQESTEQAASRIAHYLASDAHPDGAAVTRAFSWEHAARTIFPTAFCSATSRQ